MKRLIRLCFSIALLACVSLAQAQLLIDVTGVGANQIPIAIAPFANESALPQSVTEIVRADLQRSGLFRIVDAGNTKLDERQAINYADWRGKADALVVGSAQKLADGRYDVRFRLVDVVKQASLAGLSYTPGQTQLRLVGHRIADLVYEKLTGDKGVFSTRIAYVLKRGSAYTLQVADADGFNAQIALSSNEPIISPAWNADGSKLAYVSFEQRKPIVYVHEIATGKRHTIANFRGSNSAPAWSPDGSKMAVTLTLPGISQLYLVSAAGGTEQPKRLTTTNAIDTEPAFSPDGKFIYFTSDRSGGPQIYRVPAGGGTAERVTFSGDYNVTPRISADGKSLTYVARREGRFRVALMDLASGQEMLLTDTNADESPSFAPNGRYILYATVAEGRDVLGVVSSDGRVKQRLSVAAGDVREPTWGPFQP